MSAKPKEPDPLTAKERGQWVRLHRLWTTGRATKSQMIRCIELDRKDREGRAALRKAEGQE